MAEHIFTSEAVTDGHPDKVCDRIADAILDEVLSTEAALEAAGYIAPDGSPARLDEARVAIECLVTTGTVIVAGEVRCQGYIDIQEVVRRTLKEIGYDKEGLGFAADEVAVINLVHEQSADIAQGVDGTAYRDDEEDLVAKTGAGDQGIMFGYACDEAPSLMPLPIALANELALKLREYRCKTVKEGGQVVLRPDGKTQVSVRYDELGRPIAIDTVLVSTSHDPIEIADGADDDYEHACIEKAVTENVIVPVLEKCGYDWADAKILVNPTGRFVTCGPQGDSGLCLQADTLIATPTGLHYIKDLKEGDKVYTETGETASIIEHYENGIRPTKRISLQNNIVIEATPNHPFRIWNGRDFKWRLAEDLQVGDVLVQRHFEYLNKNDRTEFFTYEKKGETIKILFDDNFSYLLGWLIGDGNTTANDRISFYFGSEEEKIHIYNKLVQSFPETEIKFYDCQPDRFLILSHDIVAQLNAIGVASTTSRQKRIPDRILRASNRKKLAFLAGLFDADGYIQDETGRDGNYLAITLTTSSYELAQQTAIMLHSMGIHSSIYNREGRDEYSIGKRGSLIDCSNPSYGVRITGLSSIRKFLNNGGGFLLPSKSQKYIPRDFSEKWHSHDSQRYYLPILITELLNLSPRKHKRYFENYGSLSSIRSNRGYKPENIEYMLDMYAEFADTDIYKKVQNLFKNYEFVIVADIQDSEALTYDISLDDNTHSFIANTVIVHNTGRKIVADSYGGMGRHGGGAFSGKDCTKVDRSAAYAARWAAKNVVAAGLASRCEIQLSYAIGVPEPISVFIDTFGTGKYGDDKLAEAVSKVFDFRPGAIIRDLRLREPIFSQTAAFGHFGREGFAWEDTSKAPELIAAIEEI